MRIRAGYPFSPFRASTGERFYFILSVNIFYKRKGRKMKKTLTSVISVVVILSFVLCLVACNEKVDATGLWENATYRSDKEFGKGEKTVEVEVKVEEQSVTFTINTDADTLGDALLEHGLIAGDDSQYGLYVKTVNGILADYDVDQSYWSFYQNGEYLMSGVDTTDILGGEHFEIVYTK